MKILWKGCIEVESTPCIIILSAEGVYVRDTPPYHIIHELVLAHLQSSAITVSGDSCRARCSPQNWIVATVQWTRQSDAPLTCLHVSV